MIHYIIDLWRDWRGFKPPSDIFVGTVGTIPPFDEFLQNYPNHIVAMRGRGPVLPWSPKAGEWRKVCRAVKDGWNTAPKYDQDRDLIWSPSDSNCVGLSLRMFNLLAYAGVPPQSMTLIACRINGADHVVLGIHLADNRLSVVDMHHKEPKPWKSEGYYGLIALV